ncbi:MAG: hypothetical protein ACE5HS_05255 [bacterium]
MAEEIIAKRIIRPHEEATLNAGEFDVKTSTPAVNLKLDFPQSVQNLITWKEEVVGSEEHCTKIFKIHNRSNFLVYAKLIKQY